MGELLLFFAILLGAPFVLILGTLAARDMDARGQDGRLYGAAMLALPVGLVLWAVGRSRHPRLPAPPSPPRQRAW